jgi:SAM-dependent methyltransferase
MEEPAVALLCGCGKRVPLTADRFDCACGASLGYMVDRLATVPPPAPYWGEIPQDEMAQFLNACEAEGWRQAVQRLSSGMQDNICDPDRAAFQDLLPIPDGSSVLDVGAGLGGLAVALARRHSVVALEGVPERARFIALRKRQDGIDNLTVVNGDVNKVRFAELLFDAIVVNGVLEWAALFDTTAPPHVIQRRFLSHLRQSLKPGGVIWLGIENRIGWDNIRGAIDHSGRRYTSLMPRSLADYVCRRGVRYRADLNVGYRTYTYSYYGYRRLFDRAGLAIRSMWVAPHGYNLPIDLVAINKAAVHLYVSRNWAHPAINWRGVVKNAVKRILSRPSLWRLLGPDFAFLLERSDA